MQAKTLAKGEPALWKAAVALCCALAFAACSGDAPGDAPGEVEATTTTAVPSDAAPAPTSTTAPAQTSPTTTSLEIASDTTLIERAAPITFAPITQVGDEFVAVAQDNESEQATFNVWRSNNGADWTSEPVTGWPAAATRIVGLEETADGLAALVEVEGHAVLLTSVDMVTWQQELLPSEPGPPVALASTGDQVSILITESRRTIIIGTLGGIFSTAPFPFDTGVGDNVTFDATNDVFTYSSDRLRGRVAVSGDGVNWSSSSPLETGSVSSLRTSTDSDVIMVGATWNETGSGGGVSTTSVWLSGDEGSTWTESVVPTELAMPSVMTTRIGEAGFAVELVQHVEWRAIAEVWFSPDGQTWSLVDTWADVACSSGLADGRNVVADRSLLDVNDSSVSIQADVWDIQAGSGMASWTSVGAFVEQIPVG